MAFVNGDSGHFMKTLKILLIFVLIFVSASNFYAQSTAATTEKAKGVFFALSVKDVESAGKWYREKLGFRLIKSGEAPNKIAKFALLETEGAVIELIQHRDAKPAPAETAANKNAHLVHGIFKIGLIVDDLDALYRSLKEKGIEIAYELTAAKDIALRTFTVRDAESNLLQFFGK